MALEHRVRRREPGRPRVVHDPVDMPVRVPADMRAALDYAAKDRRVSRQELVRQILHGWLTEERTDEDELQAHEPTHRGEGTADGNQVT